MLPLQVSRERPGQIRFGAKRSTGRPWKLVLLLCAGLGAGAGCTSGPQAQVTGTVSYRERIALPPDAVLELRLEDVSRQDAPAAVVARKTLDPAPPPPILFVLEYDPDAIDERHTYAVRATIRRGDTPLFVTDTAHLVLTRDHPAHANIVLVRSGGGEAPVGDATLVGTRWLLRTLGGEAIEPGQQHPFLQIHEEDGVKQAFGLSGCNRFRGSLEVAGSSLSFGPLAGTRMACPPPAMEIESRFLGALADAASYEIRSTWLVLKGPQGELATFEAWYE